MKILLIRMDRLGDLVCTLPVDQHPKLKDPSTSVTWLISKGLEPVIENALPARSFWSIPTLFSWRIFFDLTQKLKQEKLDQVILFYAPWWVALACWWAGIPRRYSPRSRWFQILFFNKTLRQTRSLSEKHEADYNGDLLHWALTGESTSSFVVPALEFKPSLPLPSSLLLPPSYIVLHPGMGGSALNWPPSFYLTLTQKLLSLGKKVVITGTPADQAWLQDLESPLRSLEGVYWLVGQLNLSSLISVLSRSEATVAPSTGVIHLAASTGVKTIGIYSPIRVQTPIRWGPRGNKTLALTPSVNCPASMHCLGSACKEYPCLEKITPEQIIAEIQRP